MARTATYGFPSPEGTSAPQGPYAIKELADAVDAQLKVWFADTGWQDLASPGFTPMTGTERPQLRKIGNRVYLRGGWLTGAGTGITAVNTSYVMFAAGTFPAAFVPPVNTVAAIGGSSGASVGTMHINADGSVYLRTGAALAAYYKWDRQSYLMD